MTTEMIAVVADIGGTNTRVALTDGTRVRASTVKRYRNAENDGIVSVLKHFLAEQGVTPDAAGVAMAGPVRDNVGTLTNLSWRVDHAEIAGEIGAAKVAVLNDLQAQGFAVPHLTGDAIAPVLDECTPGGTATRLVVGVGTGLNAAVIQPVGPVQTVVPASEAGHITLPVQSEAELRLLDWLRSRHGTPGIEDALSGRGLERLYMWRCREDGEPQARALSAAEIMEACTADPDSRAGDAVRAAIGLLGRYAGNLCLIHLPFGGLYLCGGVARALQPFLGPMGFAAAFRDKGRFSSFMEQFPVAMVTDDYAALTGTAHHLGELMQS